MEREREVKPKGVSARRIREEYWWEGNEEENVREKKDEKIREERREGKEI